jgi:hypothetical protein
MHAQTSLATTQAPRANGFFYETGEAILIILYKRNNNRRVTTKISKQRRNERKQANYKRE